MKEIKTSERKQKLIDELNTSPIEIGESIWVKNKAIYHFTTKKDENNSTLCIVLKLNKKSLIVRHKDNSVFKDKYAISYDDISSRYITDIGENPFDERYDNIRPVAFTLESIIFNLNVDGEKGDKYEIKGVPVKTSGHYWNHRA